MDNASKQSLQRIPYMAASDERGSSSIHRSRPGKFLDLLLGPDMNPENVDPGIEPGNVSDMNMPNVFEGQWGNEILHSLVMSNVTENPSLSHNCGGTGIPGDDQVGESSSNVSVPMGNFFPGQPINASYENINSRALLYGLTYGTWYKDDVPRDAFSVPNQNFSLFGHTFNQAGDDFAPMGQSCNHRVENTLPMDQPHNLYSFTRQGSCNLVANPNFFSVHESDIRNNGMVPIYQTRGMVSSNMASAFPASNLGEGNISHGIMSPTNQTNNKTVSNMVCPFATNSNVVSNTISAGGFHGETGQNNSGWITGNSGLSVQNHSNSVQEPELPSQQKDMGGPDANPNASGASSSKGNRKPTKSYKRKRSKEAEELPLNIFPANVGSLLSTGIFDGVHVKYVSWARDRSLRGVIKGNGYICSCKNCKSSEVITAHEFERHANCKTKHPNNHIYFGNGKTVYGVVQELKKTPPEMLYDVIQKITGASINQTNFSSWKASYEAATLVLDRIYGKSNTEKQS